MKTFVSGLALAALTLTGAASAATTPAPAPQTTTSAQAIAPAGLIDKLSLNFYTELYGPSLTSVTGDSLTPASMQPKADGTNSGSKVFFDNTLRLGYKLTDKYAVRVGFNFGYFPVRGQQFKVEDSYLQFAGSKLIDAGGFSLAADARLYGGVSQSSREADLNAMIRLDQVAEYKVGNSRWTVGLATFERPFFYGASAKADHNTWEMYAAPSLAYQATPSLAGTLVWETAALHKAGKGPFEWDSEGTYLEPGVSWDITQAINLNPFVTFQSFHINPESTTFNLIVSAKIL